MIGPPLSLKEYRCITKQTKTTKTCFKCCWLFWQIAFICDIRISVEFHKEKCGCFPHFLNEIRRNSWRFTSLLVTVIPRQWDRGFIFCCACYHELTWWLPKFMDLNGLVVPNVFWKNKTARLYNLTLYTEYSQIGYKNMF